MCLALQEIRIKGVSRFSPTHSFVPCGKCTDCRKIQHSSWYTRLFLELKACVAQGWHVGFITLTYNDDNLPHFENSAFIRDDVAPATPVPCFSRRDVTALKDGLRKFIWKNFNKEKSIKYIICSEYGEHTRRPHYHALFCCPPSVDMRSVYDYISTKWNSIAGYVFPRQYDGFYSNGIQHNGFLVDTSTELALKNACYYAAKYVCKDLAFAETIPANINKDSESYKDGKQFHCQSRSLGYSYLLTLTPKQKLEILQNGISFVGEDTFKQVPAYFKNKIVYDVYYITDENGKRLVRKKANDFFRENFQTIFEIKKRYLKDCFEQLLDPGFYLSRGLTNDEAQQYITAAYSAFNGLSVDDVSSFAIARYGTKYESNYNVPDCTQYLIRYSDVFTPNGYVYNLFDLDNVELMSREVFCDLTTACKVLYQCLMDSAVDTIELNEREFNRVRDFHKNIG